MARRLIGGVLHPSTRARLLIGVSGLAVSSLVCVAPAQAQLAALRAAAGNVVVGQGAGTQAGVPTSGVTTSMAGIIARQTAYRAQIAQQANIVASANAAARQAAQNAAVAASISNGLGGNGLKPVDLANQNTSALSTWVGASQPTQTTATTGTVNVAIDQSQSRALLSWDSFNVGQNTALTFNQGGHSDWVAVNRVVGEINPQTGLLDPSLTPSPSQILGSIKADGSVFILNRAGVIFGATAQVNLHSLVASSLELGAASVPAGNSMRTISLADRNNAYLQNGIIPTDQSTLLAGVTGETYGAVQLAQGGQINATGGFVILAAPTVASAGAIAAGTGGQISLEAGKQIDAIASSGASDSVDPFARGLVLASVGGGTVTSTGSLDAQQGYISVGTDQTGIVNIGGIITSTTSVSRNGKISLIGGTVNVAPDTVLSIQADSGTSTIPQSPASLAAFKTSQIDIGARWSALINGQIVSAFSTEAGREKLANLVPGNIAIGAGALIDAPSGTVNIGGTASSRAYLQSEIGVTRVSVAENATFDVGGIADFLVDASRNQLEISPAKRNELRDTPTYREVTTDGSFTLNGATIFVDPRLSGVRSDGVAWIGSPLIEAASVEQQIGLTAPEIMTKGGNITLRTAQVQTATATVDAVSVIDIAASAVLDFSGGWIRYRDGFVKSSKLITSDGRIVDIAQADPNDSYVAIANGFVQRLPQLVTPRVFQNAQSSVATFQPGYAEGRDAGSLTIVAPTASIGAVLHGEAVQGARQISNGQAPSAASTLAGDIRRLQGANGQLAAGGLLRVSALLGGNIAVGRDPSSLAAGTIYLDDSRLSAAGLSGLSLQTSGAVTFAAASNVTLANGGALNVDAGRRISFDGDITAAGGAITASTYEFRAGSIFTTDDDLYTGDYIVNPSLAAGSFDILVNAGATLSTRGRWVNDLLVTDGFYGGNGFTSGGSISLTSAPRVVAFADATQTSSVDLSGSIRVAAGGLLDVSGGGYVSPTGNLSLIAKGGNVSLINDTSYFQLYNENVSNQGQVKGVGLFGTDLTTFQLTPVAGVGYSSAIVPDAITSVVDIATGTIRAFGFQGSGTFTLVTPDMRFGTSGGTGTAVPLDFLANTGFGTLDLTAWNTSFVPNVLNNGRPGSAAILSTEQIVVNAGDTLNLTQSILPTFLSAEQITRVSALATGTDISRSTDLTPTNQLGDYDNLAANLILGGMSELDVLGGTIVGAPGATIKTPRLLNDGTIRIAGGSMLQRAVLPQAYLGANAAIGLHPILASDGSDKGAAFAQVFGPADPNGRYDATALVAAPYQNTTGTRTIRDFLAAVQADHPLYYLGRLDADQGIVLSVNSITDLSGISIRNPRAPVGTDGTALATGRILTGGSIVSEGFSAATGSLFLQPSLGERFFPTVSQATTKPLGATPALRLEADSGAVISLAGASDSYDIQTGPNSFTLSPMWSDAGSLIALGGGMIAGAVIDAHGGATQAEGGSLEWIDPVFRQNAATSLNADALSADQITAAGFDSVIARGTIAAEGDVSLSLARFFALTSKDFTGVSPDANDPYFDTAVASTGNLSIVAPHVVLRSVNQKAGSLPGAALREEGHYSFSLTGTSSLDIAGGVSFGYGFDKVSLITAGDLRVIGVEPTQVTYDPTAPTAPSLGGGIIVAGDLLLRAAQIYATTGTGGLQQSAAGVPTTPTPFVIASLGGFTNHDGVFGKPDAVIRFERASDATPTLPYSAGSYISVIGQTIEQAGILRAPLGRIDLGTGTPTTVFSGFTSASGSTGNLSLLAGSITSVSANGLNIPYGTTIDLTDYYFSPTTVGAIAAPPVAQLGLAGGTIAVDAGAVVDASGGGSLYAYEFTSGTGGSRDLLNRFNGDLYSTNNGFQYPGGRQIYAILPAGSPQLAALYDPVYSADYADLYGSAVGQTVQLDAGNGFAGGTYVLMPAKYALLPGAMRLVENVGNAAPLADTTAKLLDGSVVVGGVLGVSGTGYVESARRSFTVQTQDVFKKYSAIVQTDATTTFQALAQRASIVAPYLPNDAARIIIDPGSSLTIGNRFDTTASNGGRGSKIDILSSLGGTINIVAARSGHTTPEGTVNLLVSDLVNLNAASLLIGGTRTDRGDGSTAINAAARAIDIQNDAANPLTAPELLFAVTGARSSLTAADGATLIASGTLGDDRAGAFDLTTSIKEADGTVTRQGVIGSLLRVSTGPQRLVDIAGDSAPTGAPDRATFTVGNSSITGNAVSMDTSRNLVFAMPSITANSLALGSDRISFSSRKGVQGLIISPQLEATFANIAELQLRSANAIAFTPGSHTFSNLVIDAPGLRLVSPTPGRLRSPFDLEIHAADVTLTNDFAALGSCKAGGLLACGATGNGLLIDATKLHFGSGTFRTTYGFDKAVSLVAVNGADYSGTGVFDVGNAALSITTPYFVDVGTNSVPTGGASPVNFVINATDSIMITARAGAQLPLPTTPMAAGAKLTLGSADSPASIVSISDATIRATAGTIAIESRGDITLGGQATLATQSYSQTFGDAADPVIASAGAGTISLVSTTGGIAIGSSARLAIGGSTGSAGTLNLLAAAGAIDLTGTIDATAPLGGASYAFDSGLSAFDLQHFIATLGTAFTGDVTIRSGRGDLDLAAGQKLKATGVSLTSDGGSVRIGGTIDTAAINGGAISLYARDQLALASTAVLDAHSVGYADSDTRQASAGDVVLGVGTTGAISVASGAAIDLTARRVGDRLVPHTQIDPRSQAPITAYTFVEADTGGTLTLRAPVIGDAATPEQVDVTFAGQVVGARDVTLLGYRNYDLAAIDTSGSTGVTVKAGVATLDAGAAAVGKTNFLSDNAPGTIVDFIQNFDISGSRAGLGSLTNLASYHERPGVELDYSGRIILASNWNLGAGTVDQAAAVADGDLQLSALGPVDGVPRYEVVAGHEAHLFQNFVSMLYRTGGRVDGAAGALTLRAGNTLDIEHSITDGFFSFGDQTDPDYISYQLGGGNRQFQPAIAVQCGGQDCSDTASFVVDTRKKPQLPAPRTSISFNLSKVSTGDETLTVSTAPYSTLTNTAAATSRQAGGGDPIGSAQLFPLLADGSGVDSFSIQLVGGAGPSASANSLHVDRASAGNVVVAGNSSYALAAQKPTGQYGGPLEVSFNDQTLAGDLVNNFALRSGITETQLQTAATRVEFGQASGEAVAFMRAAAEAFFADYPSKVQFVGPADKPTGFAAPFGLVAQFLQSTDASGQTLLQRFGTKVADGSFGYTDPQPAHIIDVVGAKTTVRSLVRTGNGTIDVSAVRNVDLTNGAVTLAGKNGGKAAIAANAAQLGGTAIYTAGQAFIPVAVAARVVGISQTQTIDPANYLPATGLQSNTWIPTVTGRLQLDPVFAHDGGSINIEAGTDVLGRRDVWSETFYANNNVQTFGDRSRFGSHESVVGTADQRWRVGSIGSIGGSLLQTDLAANIRVNAQQFSAGIGTLGGGKVSIRAGGDVNEVTMALDTTVATGDVGDSFGSMVFGGGDLNVIAGGNISGGRIDVSTGLAKLVAGGNIGSQPTLGDKGALDVRLTDTVLTARAGGTIDLGYVSALGVNVRESANAHVQATSDLNALGYYTGISGLDLTAYGTVSIGDGPNNSDLKNLDNILPATLDVTSFAGDVDLSMDRASILYPGATGQLSLLAGGTLNAVAVDLEDSDPSLLPGIFSANQYIVDVNGAGATEITPLFGRLFGLPVVLPNTSDGTRRLLHNANPTHSGDASPARIAVGGSLDNLTLYLAKSARISAGGDIVNMIFSGQNLSADDTTRIYAARDITASTAVTALRPLNAELAAQFTSGKLLVNGNQFVLGGPGAFFLEAGRDLGPFLNSATTNNVTVFQGSSVANGGTSNYAGGILAVGNDYNPYLAPKSADIYAFFGVGKGMDFNTLRDTYVDPANVAALDGDLFKQNVDIFGNKTPDRTRPIYAPILIAWMQANAGDALIAAYGTTDVTIDQAYSAFAALPALTQRRFLLDRVYFNELAAPSQPDGNSYLQYVRGYRAVETLFPADLGYTANDLSGTSNGGTKVSTGNLDLRLAAIETTRDSNITILGPGGNAILGSVTRTSEQAAARAYQPQIFGSRYTIARPRTADFSFQVQSIPLGYEGILTLRGGSINGFTDGDLRLNQSRLFTQQSGDIVLWSSNGDLNAGQGPKSAGSVPPIVLRFNQNGGGEVDAAGGVVGAGIAGFAGLLRLDAVTGQFDLIDVQNDPDAADALTQLTALARGAQVIIDGKTYSRALPSITLVAPAGTVDAGDAGVRASGDIFVAAAQVTNADNFKVGGNAIGVPSLATPAVPALPAGAASALVANIFRAPTNGNGDQRSQITVDVLGFYGTQDDKCRDANSNVIPNCTPQQ